LTKPQRIVGYFSPHIFIKPADISTKCIWTHKSEEVKFKKNMA
jgi:hypothetical protein